jgi:hypothetical protein
MIDTTKIVLTITLLLGTIGIGGKPPAGGVPIPQHTSGVQTAQ